MVNCLPIMLELWSKLAYYASIMLNALARLLYLKLCRHNRHRPNECTNPGIAMNNAINGMTIFICVFKCQNATHVDTVKEYKV